MRESTSVLEDTAVGDTAEAAEDVAMEDRGEATAVIEADTWWRM